jgi:hypothetical protein
MRSQYFRRTIRLGTSLLVVATLAFLLMIQSPVAQTSGKSFKIGFLGTKQASELVGLRGACLDLKLLKKKLTLLLVKP